MVTTSSMPIAALLGLLLLFSVLLHKADASCLCNDGTVSCSHVKTEADLLAIPTTLRSVMCLSKSDKRVALEGDITSAIGQLTSLTWLHLEGAVFASIPSGIGALTNLEFLWLLKNEFGGEIPSSIGALTKLTSLNLNDNALRGSLPSALGALSALQNLELFGNALTGPIPSQLGQLTELTSLWLNRNRLSGTLPAAVAALPALRNFVVSDNALTGGVPAIGSGSLKSLYVLSPAVCGSAPQFTAVHSDLPSGGALIVDCAEITDAPTPLATEAPSPAPTRAPLARGETHAPTVTDDSATGPKPAPSAAARASSGAAAVMAMLLAATTAALT